MAPIVQPYSTMIPSTPTETVVAFKMITYTHSGNVFKTVKVKTKRGLSLSKQRQNLAYGAHLRAETFEILADGTERKAFLAAALS